MAAVLNHIDTVLITVRDTVPIYAFDLVDRIDSIYSRSFNLIIVTFGIFAGLSGIVIPLLIAFWQNRSLKLKEKEIADKVLDTEKRLKSQIDFKVQNMESTISSYRTSLDGLYNKYFDLFSEQLTFSRFIDIKIQLSTVDFIGPFSDLCRFLNEAVASDGIYKSNSRIEALYLLRAFDISKIEHMNNHPNDVGQSYAKIVDAENALKALIAKRILKDEDEKVVLNIHKIVSEKRAGFPADQKGIFLIIENRP